jgi:hypothetical protein
MIGTVLAVAVTAAALGVTGSATGHSGTAAPTAPTSVRAVRPLDAQGHLDPAYRVKHRYGNANCESGSPTTGKAYQCFTPQAPQGIFDSCWVQASPGLVACLVKPWMHDVVQLHVTRGFDNAPGFLHVHAPWGLRIATNTRCLVDLGSVHSANGHPITYRCNHKTVLTGAIDRHGATWRILGYRRIAQKGKPLRFVSLGREPIAVAWSGKPSRRSPGH